MKEIGNLLKEARESKGLDVEDAARELKIRPYYIEILESGDISAVSSEIYLTGYLKSYANWLGIDNNKIATKLKADGNKLFVSDKVKKESSSFFGFDDDLVSPGGFVTLVSFILAMIIYTFWHKESDIVMPSFNVAIEKEVTSGGRNWADGLAAKGDKFLLVAQDVVTLRIKENGGEFVSKRLEMGDIYFLSSVGDVVVESDNPAAIDVFADDGKSTFLGSLAKVSEVNMPGNEGEKEEKSE
jgi:transcriptional regulator with XRE-family HTH domain